MSDFGSIESSPEVEGVLQMAAFCVSEAEDLHVEVPAVDEWVVVVLVALVAVVAAIVASCSPEVPHPLLRQRPLHSSPVESDLAVSHELYAQEVSRIPSV